MAIQSSGSSEAALRVWPYAHWDVFTSRRFTGNQLAVFPEAAGLEPGAMQRVAAEMAFSETTFVFPAEAAGTDFRVRIFTPAAELPMAGHPVIGTVFALARQRRIAPGTKSCVLGLGAGPTEVELEWREDDLHFAWMRQAVPTVDRSLPDLRGLAVALGIREGGIRQTGLPVEESSAGVPFLLVPMASRADVDGVSVDRSALQRFCAAAGTPERPLLAFCREPAGAGATAYSRMFAPVLGVAEDPATGSAAGPLGAYLVRHGLVGADEAKHMINLQGVQLGRPSEIHISVRVRTEDGGIDQVQVGGEAVYMGEGTLEV